MREQVHTALTAFRINPALLAAASAKAKREGVTLSELLRHAVRKEVRGAA
jgi:predicted HicB family RNase H-like nuclease